MLSSSLDAYGMCQLNFGVLKKQSIHKLQQLHEHSEFSLKKYRNVPAHNTVQTAILSIFTFYFKYHVPIKLNKIDLKTEMRIE